jgi:hypothetical protein
MARDVTLRAVYSDLAGDETYELWLKHESDPWLLGVTGDVVLDVDHQDFTLLTLTAGDTYVAQLRLKRAGRYRTGYLSGNPDAWPAQSRCEFTPGALEGVGAPLAVSAVWSRTSSVSQKIAFTITPDDPDIDLNVYRDGILVGTIAAPHVGDVVYNDVDPTIAVEYEYTAAHVVSGGLIGPVSGPQDCFAGPLPPVGFVQTSGPTTYGEYTVDWLDDGRSNRIEDDYLCVATAWALVTGGAAVTTGPLTETKEPTALPAGGTQAVAFHARIRATETAFTVDDVSDWVTINIDMEIDDPDDNTNFDTCP